MHTKHPFFPRVIPVGETAFTVELCDSIDWDCNLRVHALDAYLQTHLMHGIVESVPTYRSLLVIYDPCEVSPNKLRSDLHATAERILDAQPQLPDESSVVVPPAKQVLLEIPVVYGGNDGPDLLDVAAHTHLTPEEVIQKHTSHIYQVAMLGFAPGFCYLLGLPLTLSTPRLATPRIHVAPGSVGIAGNQTGVYALGTPGGWRIIGRTYLNLFDPARNEPFILQAGDHVRFNAIRREDTGI